VSAPTVRPPLTIEQAAVALTCSKSLIYRLIDEGELQAFHLVIGAGRNTTRVTAESIDELRARRAVAPKITKRKPSPPAPPRATS